MAITVTKDYSLPFAKNDDYIYLDSDKKEEQQFRYGLHYLYNESNIDSSDLSGASNGFFVLNSSFDLKIYNNSYCYVNTQTTLFNQVPLFINKVVQNNTNEYKFFYDKDKLISDSYWFYNWLNRSGASVYNVFHCVTKKVASNNDGYGVFSVNDVFNNLLSNNSPSINFKYLPFEEYLYVLRYDVAEANSSSFNIFTINGGFADDNRLSFSDGDYVIVQDDSQAFYNGVQKVNKFSLNFGNFYVYTDKPALKGVSNSGGLMYRADYEATPFSSPALFSSEKTAFYSGLKFEDIAGLNDTELNNLVSNYVSGDKVLSYAPREQKTYINDIGELWIGKDELLDLIVTYEVEDLDGVLHYYDYTDNDDLDIYKIPSNPASINSKIMDNNAARGLPVIQECDKSYKILISYADEFFKFDLLKDTKFERVRLLFSDLLGSVNGFNFALYNAKTVSTSKDTFTKDINDFSNLNTIKFNKDSRGKADVSTNVKYKLRLNSDFLTQEESNYFEDLLISNDVKMQYKGDIIAVNIPSRSVVIKEKVNGLVRYALDVEYSINRTIW